MWATLVLDSRTLHAGTANRAPGTRRAMFCPVLPKPTRIPGIHHHSDRASRTVSLFWKRFTGSSARKKAKLLAKEDPRWPAAKEEEEEERGLRVSARRGGTYK